MKENIKLNIKQNQKNSMTHELSQSIELLQLNQLGLYEKIKDEVENNPILEIKNNGKEFIYNKKTVDFLKFSYDEYNLYDELFFQLNMSNISEFYKYIGGLIINSIDENGYLKENLENIKCKFKLETVDILNVLKIVQSFEPKGIGARNLKECLVLQIEKEDILLKKIIENHLEDIASNKINKIASELNEEIYNINKNIEKLKTLNPKPGASYSQSSSINYVNPDVRIEKKDGVYNAILLNDYIPEIYISKKYEGLLKSKDTKVKEYVIQKYERANWLISSIEQRNRTILKIVNIIAERQKNFFDKGLKFLNPINQKEMAKIADVHASTISRVARDKYIETPQGTFEMKYFFDNKIFSDTGKDTSVKYIKSKIKNIISFENPYEPYSDEAIKNELKKVGYNISRRTIAKYRHELNIENSSKRKKIQ